MTIKEKVFMNYFKRVIDDILNQSKQIENYLWDIYDHDYRNDKDLQINILDKMDDRLDNINNDIDELNETFNEIFIEIEKEVRKND